MYKTESATLIVSVTILTCEFICKMRMKFDFKLLFIIVFILLSISVGPTFSICFI